MSTHSDGLDADGYATFRGVILDHQPGPFYFQIDREVVISMAADDVRTLRRAAETAHARSCKTCKGSNLTRRLDSTIYAPAGRLDLDIPLKATELDWTTVRAFPPDALLHSTRSDPPVRIYSADKAQLNLHVVLLFNARDERAPSPPHKYKPSLQTSCLGGRIFQLHAQGQRPLKVETWPTMVDDFRLTELKAGHVFIDNTLCLTEIEDGLLVSKESRFCAIFASPGLNPLRLFTFLEFYHSVFLRMSYARLFSQLAVSRNVHADARSNHISFIVDFTAMSWSPGFFESVDTLLSQIRTFLWQQVVRFEGSCRLNYAKALPELPYCGGDEVVRSFLERIHTYELTFPLFVVIHGVEELFERPVLASLWANLPHPAVSVVRDRLDQYLFAPVINQHERPDSLVRKVLLTGLCPQWIVAGTALERVHLINISAHPSASPLHGVLFSDATQVLDLLLPVISPADHHTIHRSWVDFSNKVRRVPRADDAVLPDELDEYHDLNNLSELARGILRIFERDRPLLRTLLSRTWFDYLTELGDISLDSNVAILELLFPLICDDFLSYDCTVRQQAAILLVELARTSPIPPDGILADLEHPIGSFSYDTLISSRTDHSHWYGKAMELLYIHGYLKCALNGDSPKHAAPYEIAGVCAAAGIINIRNQWVRWKITTPGFAREPSAVAAPPSLSLSADVLAELIFKIFRDRAPAQSEQEFQDIVVDALRKLLALRGLLPNSTQTEIWVRYALEPRRSCDGRLDVLVFQRSADGGPDTIHAMEFKIRLLKCIIKDILARLKELGKEANLRCTTTDNEEQAQGYLRVDIQHVHDIELHPGCYVDSQPRATQAPAGTFTALSVMDVLGSYEIEGDRRSAPTTIMELCSQTIPQLTGYVKAMLRGVQDEVGYKPGLADVRVTKISDSGSTVIIPIVVVSYGCELVSAKELPSQEIQGRVAVTGTFPWSRDRRNTDASDKLADKPRWTDFRTTEDVLQLKRNTRMNLCPFL